MAVDSSRTCIGCGSAAQPDDLERFVFEPAIGLVHDLRRKAPGRGAWVHASVECLTTAVRSGFRRSFRADVSTPSAEELVAAVAKSIRVRVDEAARLAIRSGAAAVGETAVKRVMKADEANLVLLASDAGDATRKKYASNAERKGIPVVERFDGATMGGWSGRDFVAVMTMNGRPGAALGRDVENLERLRFFEA